MVGLVLEAERRPLRVVAAFHRDAPSADRPLLDVADLAAIVTPEEVLPRPPDEAADVPCRFFVLFSKRGAPQVLQHTLTHTRAHTRTNDAVVVPDALLLQFLPLLLLHLQHKLVRRSQRQVNSWTFCKPMVPTHPISSKRRARLVRWPS